MGFLIGIAYGIFMTAWVMDTDWHWSVKIAAWIAGLVALALVLAAVGI